MNPSELTLDDCELVAGPAATWVGRCHEVADAVNRRLKLGLYLAYGAFRGCVRVTSPLYRPGLSWARHGWLEASDGAVLDPTRWVFEDCEPYLFRSQPGRVEMYRDLPVYDAGNDVLRQYLEKLRDVPGADAHEKIVPLRVDDQATVEMIRLMFGCAPGELNLMQVAHLANASRHSLGQHARAVFAAICAAGHRTLIPVDNYDYVLGRDERLVGDEKPTK